MTLITLFGGAGFLNRRIVERLDLPALLRGTGSSDAK
jgi:hypothetical protein